MVRRLALRLRPDRGADRNEHDALAFELRRPVGDLLRGGGLEAHHADGGPALLGRLFELCELLGWIAAIDLNIDREIVETDGLCDLLSGGFLRGLAIDVKQTAPFQ